MKTIILTLLLVANAYAFNKAVYGTDNRTEAQKTIFSGLAGSTSVMIPTENISLKFDFKRGFHLEASGEPMSETGVSSGFFMMGDICPEVRFSEQPQAGVCSGFLIAPDLLVTAGHCMTSQEMCDNYSWAFEFYVNEENKAKFKFQDVYKCKEIVSQKLVSATLIGDYSYYMPPLDSLTFEDYDYSEAIDYAIVRLNRKVRGRAPLKLRRFGAPILGSSLIIIGNPMGLPTKVAGDARILRDDLSNMLVSNLDAFGGNSGSAVIDPNTGIVEGILVSGEQDYKYDSTRKCYTEKICGEDDCDGELITRITALPELEDLVDWW